MHCLETIRRLNAEREAAEKPPVDIADYKQTIADRERELRLAQAVIAEIRAAVWEHENATRLDVEDTCISEHDAALWSEVNDAVPRKNKPMSVAAFLEAIEDRDSEIAMLKEQLAGMEVQVKRSDSARGDATDSFYQWIRGKTMPGSRPSPKECYEAGYNNALAGIPNPEAVRDRIEHLAKECDRLADSLQSPETTKGICAAFAKTIADDLRALTAPPRDPGG